MNIVVTVDENWAIGNKGSRLLQIPADQRNFQKLTTGKTVVLGRKTQQDLPQGIPFYYCQNIILSKNPSYHIKGGEVVHSLDELRELLKDAPETDIYVCGGNSLYEQLFPYCDTAYVTMIEKSYEANEHIPNLDRDSQWQLTEESEEQTYFDMTYYFRKYVKK
ncbi:MAG TPA: dihydrofolate reductase [Lachnospiraceae bacterium]|nr:dihydrofolate reductase [Lachnospiraceae bacterium]